MSSHIGVLALCQLDTVSLSYDSGKTKESPCVHHKSILLNLWTLILPLCRISCFVELDHLRLGVTKFQGQMKLPIFQVEFLLFPRCYGSSWDVASICLPLEVARGPLVFTLGFLVSRKVGIWFSLAASVAANTNECEWNFSKCDLWAHVSFEIFRKCYRLTYRLTLFDNPSGFHRELLKVAWSVAGPRTKYQCGASHVWLEG